MKKILLTAFLLIFQFFAANSQNNYYDFNENNKKIVFHDDFSDNRNKWFLESNLNQSTSIENGVYTLVDKDGNRGWKEVHQKISIDIAEDFEIEFKTKLVYPNSNGGIKLFFGKSFVDANVLGIYKDASPFALGTYDDFYKYSNNGFISYSIDYDAYNLFTIRKVKNVLQIYYNTKFVYQSSVDLIPIEQIGFMLSNYNSIKIDDLKVSYLNKQQNTVTNSVLLDNTAPSIVLHYPSVDMGKKIVETNKQISVRGKATDNSGIYELTINDVEAEMNADGEFQGNVKLAIGENTITIKATDTKNNTGTYTFYVNRQSGINNEVVKNEVLVNDNPDLKNEKRLALVIGNSNYGGGLILKNPANDADLMAGTLQNLGFEVIKRIDANKQAMEQAIRDFSNKLPNCNVALFYYAGHGLQVDGLNYLIPIDAKLNSKIDCKFEAISVNYVVEEFERYPENTNIVILDACRNDPFRTWARGGERGFKAISPTSGTIIAFATSEGATASDGTGNNGLFTQQLVKQMCIKQPIESVFKKTRVEVEKSSNGTQSPQEWSKLKGDFYFKQ